MQVQIYIVPGTDRWKTLLQTFVWNVQQLHNYEIFESMEHLNWLVPWLYQASTSPDATLQLLPSHVPPQMPSHFTKSAKSGQRYIQTQTYKYRPASCIRVYTLYLLFTKMVKKAYEVTNKMYYSVGVGTERGVRITAASHVRCNYMITMVSQKGDLVAPWIPEFWEAMKKKH